MIDNLVCLIISIFLAIICTLQHFAQVNFVKKHNELVDAQNELENFVWEEIDHHKELKIFAIKTTMKYYEETENYEGAGKCKRALEELNRDE